MNLLLPFTVYAVDPALQLPVACSLQPCFSASPSHELRVTSHALGVYPVTIFSASSVSSLICLRMRVIILFMLLNRRMPTAPASMPMGIETKPRARTTPIPQRSGSW